MIKGKTFLITGGTGSFGSTFANYLLKYKPKAVYIFSRDEKKQFDMRNQIKSQIVKFIIGDIREADSINEACDGIDYVFHAAALKQVPSCEFFPMEAIKTNIIGTDNVINACHLNKVKKLVILSTDKAVSPVNAMGMTKALAEKIMVSKNLVKKRSKTIICATRYGNVMNSRGSVIPLFVEKILNNEYATITDPNMTRFLMSLDESVELVMHAFKEGKNGDILVQKSNSTNLITLTKSLFKILNKKEKIKYIGIRVGEKMHESLINSEEMFRVKEFKKFFIIKPISFKYSSFFSEGSKFKGITEYSSNTVKNLNIDETIKMLKKIKIKY